MRGFILEQVKLGMPLFSAQKELIGEQRSLSTKLGCVCGICMYVCVWGDGCFGVFGI